MAKLMYRLILVFVAAGVQGGCAAAALTSVSSLLPPSSSALEIHSQTDVKLEQANFKVVAANVAGRSRGFALFGLITFVPAEYTKAVDQLYSRIDVPSGRPRTLANLVVERSSSFWLLFSIPEVSIRADVVEFTGPAHSSPSATNPAATGPASAP